MENQINSNTETYVFLFDADIDALGGNYGVPCEKMVFDAVLALRQPVRARVYSGDMMLAELCQRVSAVKKSPAQSSTTLRVDRDLYISLLTELVRSIREQENFIATVCFQTGCSLPNLGMGFGYQPESLCYQPQIKTTGFL